MSVKRALATMAVAVAAMAALTTPATATTSPSSKAPKEVVDIVNRINGNQANRAAKLLSDADRETLLKKYPEWADRIMDPDRAGEVTESEQSSGDGVSTMAYCPGFDRYINYYGVSGAKVVEWHHSLTYCIPDGTTKVQRTGRRTYLNNAVDNWERGTYRTNDEVGNNTTWYSSAFQEPIRQCVFNLPCGVWQYPYSKFVVNGSTRNVDYYYSV
ncbi:hypothetical protein SAMN05216275_16913 [Streptosporangium canum]|uniref:Secreted protein n=1 Tax=Streptosporangium canum TaxID=324952 RepID=A0A1I4FQU3_9ACTN|nr:hypothetical protein [Streptosporangium canum]SFL19923.1 hypothetical protein SAMN05216275_16913 [Streptosporangium canum]